MESCKGETPENRCRKHCRSKRGCDYSTRGVASCRIHRWWQFKQSVFWPLQLARQSNDIPHMRAEPGCNGILMDKTM